MGGSAALVNVAYLVVLILRLLVLIQLLLQALSPPLRNFLARNTSLDCLLRSVFVETLCHDTALTSLGCLDDAASLVSALALAIVVSSSLLENASASVLETAWAFLLLLGLLKLILVGVGVPLASLVLLGVGDKVALLLHFVGALSLRVRLVTFAASDPSEFLVALD